MIKTTLFYSHLINLKDLIRQLQSFGLRPEEHDEIIEIVEDTLHHRILIAILDILPEEHHEVFIARFTKTPHDRELLKFLRENAVSDPEVKIMSEAEIAKREFLFDIHFSKPKKRQQGKKKT